MVGMKKSVIHRAKCVVCGMFDKVFREHFFQVVFNSSFLGVILGRRVQDPHKLLRCSNLRQYFAVNYCCKALHLRCVQRSLIHLCLGNAVNGISYELYYLVVGQGTIKITINILEKHE